MKFKTSLIVLITTSLWGCKSDINLFEYFDKNAPIILHTNKSVLNNIDLKGREIFPNDAIYVEFLKWIDTNKSGWQTTVASFSSEAFIEQDEFKFLYLKDGGVVIIFLDKDKNAKQYIKMSKKGDLYFFN